MGRWGSEKKSMYHVCPPPPQKTLTHAPAMCPPSMISPLPQPSYILPWPHPPPLYRLDLLVLDPLPSPPHQVHHKDLVSERELLVVTTHLKAKEGAAEEQVGRMFVWMFV